MIPILCLILFILFIEYRLKKHLDKVDNSIKDIKDRLEKVETEYNLTLKLLLTKDDSEIQMPS